MSRSRSFDANVLIGDDEIEVCIQYDYNPGYEGFNVGPSGPTDGATPPEPREVEEVTSCKRIDTGEELIDNVDGDTLNLLDSLADDDLIRYSEMEQERNEAGE